MYNNQVFDVEMHVCLVLGELASDQRWFNLSNINKQK